MKRLILLCIPLLFVLSCNKELLLKFELSTDDVSYIDCPVSIDISSIASILPEVTDDVLSRMLILEEKSRKGIKTVPIQVSREEGSVLWFLMDGVSESGITRSYELRFADNKEEGTFIRYRLNENEIMFQRDSNDLLGYRIKEKIPPEGIDTLYQRSAYIHPLFSPGGEVLTRIQPPDHYHHYGIWNPWTLTHINGREIDYWNLAKGEGTVRHKEMFYMAEGTLYGQFIAAHEYIDFGSDLPERKTMDENWDCKIWNTFSGGKRYAVDLDVYFTNVLKDTILLDAYRYGGGLGFRATEKWNATNCTVLTSEGMDRKTADGTKARWCLVEGAAEVSEGRSGILFLSHPGNREHPEPMRVWPEEINHGEMFFEFCPIRHTEWIIEPRTEYQLSYRMIVFDGELSPEEADMYWNSFAKSPRIKLY